MKLKQQQHQAVASPAFNGAGFTLIGANLPNANANVAADELNGSMTTIWTRSAAFRAAQQQQQQSSGDNLLPPPPPPPPPPSNFSSAGHHGTQRRVHNHHHHHGHNHHQHTLGKIVKPIPVRPMSSSSSSTHSSSFSSALHHHHHHQQHHLVSAAAAAAKVALAAASGQDQAGAGDLALTKGAEPGESFSLIAKYFASFPATRLKSTTMSSSDLVLQQQHHHGSSNSQSQSPVLNAAPAESHLVTSFRPMAAAGALSQTNPPAMTSHNATAAKSTPFMPFKKQSAVNPKAPEHTDTPTTTTTTLFLRSHTQNANQSTDHLCTNFKRMIKLNDQNDESLQGAAGAAVLSATAAAPVNTANTPTAADTNAEIATATALASFAGQGSDHQHHYPCPYSAEITSGTPLEPPSRFGQIQMETRSTRKFLIKHHPYLQYNSNLASSPGAASTASTNPASRSLLPLQNPMRPSMDLIKMKKLISASASASSSSNRRQNSDDDENPPDNQHESSPLIFNRSGRSSRSTNSQGHQQQQASTTTAAVEPAAGEDLSRLVKFIDTIPSSSPAATGAAGANRTATPTMGPPKTIPSHSNSCPNSASSLNKSLRIANKRRQTKDSLDSPLPDPHKPSSSSSANNKTRSSVVNKSQVATARPCMENENCNCADNQAPRFDMLTCDDYFGSSIMNDDDCQEEDSSGYYSSYQSVDLISSSGASSGGERHHTKATLNLDHLIGKSETAHPTAANTVANTNESYKQQQQQQQQQQQPVPHHHYHTRYLSNYLQQSTPTSTPTASATTKQAGKPTTTKPQASSPSTTTPTTRLRYQQQLAAAAAAAASSSSSKHHLEHLHYQHHHEPSRVVECCDGDIDLDLIEND